MKQLFFHDLDNLRDDTVEKAKQRLVETAVEMGFASNKRDPFKIVDFKDPVNGTRKHRLEAVFYTFNEPTENMI